MMPTYVEHLDVLHRVEETLNRHGVTTRDGITTMIWFAPDQLSDAFEELYVSNGGRLLYDATLVDAVCEDKHIRYIVVMTVNGLQAIAAGNFVDATGDAVLTRMAGVPTSSGDENGDNQVSSLRFIMGGIDVENTANMCCLCTTSSLPSRPAISSSLPWWQAAASSWSPSSARV